MHDIVLGRKEDIISKKPEYSVVSLFCGAGGLDMGFSREGFHTIWANDMFEDATRTMRAWSKGTRVLCGDITKISSLLIPKASVMLGGFPCFVEGTLVTTKRGMIPVEKVLVGDYVLTLENRFRKVLTLMHDKKKGIHKLKIQGSIGVSCTDNHPFLVRKFYWEVNNNKKKVLKSTSPTKTMAKDIVPGDYVGVPINTENRNKYELTEQECILIGLFIGNGQIIDNKIEIVGAKHKLVEAVDTYKLDGSIRKWNNKYRYSFENEKILNIVKSFGSYRDLNIPSSILDLPIPLLEKVIQGVNIVAGSVQTGGMIRLTTEKESLLLQLAQMVMKVYKVGYAVGKYVSRGSLIVPKPHYIMYRTERNKNMKWYYEDNKLWFKVRNNEFIEDYNRTTYNLEVEEDHTYVVNNIGTFNCQGFSMMGNRLTDDPRNFLYKQYIRVLEHVQPYVFLGENVEGILTMENGLVIDRIVKEFSEIGYNVSYQLVNASDYGVPEDRKRVIIVGYRKDLEDARFPVPPMQERVVQRDVLWGIEEPHADDVHMGSFSPRFMTVNRLRGWDDPAYTILAGGRGCPLHPSSPPQVQLKPKLWRFGEEGLTRRYAWWEAAIIQSFPTGMLFYGSLEAKYKQVGNAVPPKLSQAFAREIYKELKRLGVPGDL